MNEMAVVGSVICTYEANFEDGNHVPRMMKQKKKRMLVPDGVVAFACCGLPTSDFFYLRKNKLLSVKVLIGGCLLNVAETQP